MKIKNKLLFGLLVGIMVGIVLGWTVIHLADLRTCPQKNCVGRAEVIPVSDRGYFPQAYEVLKGAKKSIHIATFELKYYTKYPDSMENKIVEELLKAHERGVDVRIVVDEYSKENNAYDYLKSKGVRIKYDGNKTTTHAKLIIVDGKVVVLGSTNLSYYGIERNNEVNLIVKDEKTADYFERYFEELWAD